MAASFFWGRIFVGGATFSQGTVENAVNKLIKEGMGEEKGLSKRAQGEQAELRAQLWFKRNGYAIKHTNWYHEHKEIDLVVETEKYRVFVEVKYNNADSVSFPESKVHKQKQKFLQQCARSYQFKFPTHKTIRFDIVSITQSAFSIQIYHIKDAFFGRYSYRQSHRLSHFCDIDFNVIRF